MEPLNKETILKDIPIFSGLSQAEERLLREKSAVIEYKKGRVIYEEGSPADAFYCVVLGRIVVYAKDRDGREEALEYLHRGKYFGIISLLTKEPHSVTARALNDCWLLVIMKDDFDFLLAKIPRLAIDLSQTLSRRLKNKDIHRKTIFESTAISVFSSYSQAGKTEYALNLALSLKREARKSVAILDICQQEKKHSMPSRLQAGQEYPVMDISGPGADIYALKEFAIKNNFGVDLYCLFYKEGDESCVKKLIGLLSILVNEYHYILLDLPAVMDNCIFGILNQSDFIHLLTSPDEVDLKRTHNLIEKLSEEFKFQENKIKVIINEYKLSKISHEEQVELLRHPVFATLPMIELVSADRLVLDEPESEYARAVRRISREVGDCLVGLTLGVGVGYGFCHIGVLKVLEEERIPVDIICGASIGAIIASLWVTGKSSAEILKITQEEFKEQKLIWNLVDLTFPVTSFIKGNKLYRFLKKYLGDKTFYDVKLPLRIVASDVKKKEPRIFDKGPLVDALMASCAMPGVFAPFRFKENLFFDGGLTNPLPTEPLFKMGVKKIIAVNVTPSRLDMLRECEELKKEISLPRELKKDRWFSLKSYLENKFKTNIIDIIFSSIEVMQYELAETESKLADIVLHPDIKGLHWMELHRSQEFAARGEEEARRNLEKIRKVINE